MLLEGKFDMIGVFKIVRILRIIKSMGSWEKADSFETWCKGFVRFTNWEGIT